MITKYVRTREGLYLLQVESEVLFPRWKFALHDGERCWPAGFGISGSRVVIPSSAVPEDIRRKLERVRESLEDLEAAHTRAR